MHTNCDSTFDTGYHRMYSLNALVINLIHAKIAHGFPPFYGAKVNSTMSMCTYIHMTTTLSKLVAMYNSAPEEW